MTANMEVLVLQGSGRRKRVERELAVRCLACGDALACPDGGDFWGWLKSGEAHDFRMTHLAHADATQVGAEMRIVEEDE